VSARHLVLGTAGHIDHGKSALVRALTGTDPDRLKEEQLRGITIELGFADLELGPEQVVSFVDVPGHERFVRHMVAGAMGVDAVLLVIAADQAVQPQTREHLDICRLLGIPRGVVALTKCDLVDRELVEVAELEVRELLAGSFLEQAPIVEVSAKTGQGLDDLRAALARLFEGHPPRPAEGIARLPVDRSFVLRGFGTVVTGTLVGGTLAEGDDVEVLPGGRRGRIRGVQVHRHKVQRAVAGQRTAVNLQGLDCDDVPRGSTVARPGTLCTTRRVWARLSLLPEAPATLRKGGPVRFHQGTCERAARLRVLREEDDGTLDVELYLGRETVLALGDRFILRRPAPVDTVGGGQIVDVQPPRRAAVEPAAFAPSALDPEVALRQRLARAGAAGTNAEALAPQLGLTRPALQSLGQRLVDEGRVVAAGAVWIDAAAWAACERRTVEALEAFHRSEPLRLGIGREELRGRVEPTLPQDAWRQLLERLSRGGRLRLNGEQVASAGHAVRFSEPERQLAQILETRFCEAGLDPPDLDALVDPGQLAQARQIVEFLIAEGKLERIQDGRLFHAGAMQGLRDRLREHAKASRRIDVATFKDLAGVTRKNAIPLLEQLDAERSTRRVGNEREILL